jgi:hypothetical protein
VTLTPTPCTEATRRRHATFRPDTPIVLMDGDTWFLADPVVRRRTLVGPGGPVIEPYLHLESEADYMPAFDETVEKSAERSRAAGDDWGAYFGAMVDPVILRLMANYYVSFEEIRELLDPGPLPWDEPRMLLVTAVTQATAETFRVLGDAVRVSLEGVMQVKASPGGSAN